MSQAVHPCGWRRVIDAAAGHPDQGPNPLLASSIQLRCTTRIPRMKCTVDSSCPSATDLVTPRSDPHELPLHAASTRPRPRGGGPKRGRGCAGGVASSTHSTQWFRHLRSSLHVYCTLLRTRGVQRTRGPPLHRLRRRGGVLPPPQPPRSPSFTHPLLLATALSACRLAPALSPAQTWRPTQTPTTCRGRRTAAASRRLVAARGRVGGRHRQRHHRACRHRWGRTR